MKIDSGASAAGRSTDGVAVGVGELAPPLAAQAVSVIIASASAMLTGHAARLFNHIGLLPGYTIERGNVRTAPHDSTSHLR
jgi:hypothetical protein